MAESKPRAVEPFDLDEALGPEEHIDLREYLRVFRKHLWLMVACFVGVTGLVAITTFRESPVYRATAKVLVDRDAPQVVNIPALAPVEGPWDAVLFFQSQVEVARSRPVVQRAMDAIRLTERRPELARAADPVARVLGAIAVEPIKNTRFIEIAVEDPDPALAAELANALANAYVSQNMDLKLAASRDAVSWLTSQVTDLKRKVNDSALALQQYQAQAGLASSEEKQSLGARKLAEFNGAYIEAKAKRLEMETRLTELKRAAQQSETELESSPVVVNDPLFQKLKGQAVELEVQRSKLLKVYKEKHPEVLKVQSQIDEVNRRIREEVDRLLRSLDGEYNVLKAREAAMLAAVTQYRTEAQDLSKKEIESGILKREAESNQQLYEILLKRLKEIGLGQGLDTNNLRLVDPAVVPARPVKPRVLYNLSLAVGGGLVLGLALALFIEYLDDRIRTAEEVEKALQVPVFGVIPVIPGGSTPSR